jgi:hypothetical protein
MGKGKQTSMDYTNMSNTVDDYEVDSSSLDTPGYSYTPNWSKWNGYYEKIPNLAGVIDKVSIWTVGSGYKTDKKTEKILNRIRGCGIDSFNSILINIFRQMKICGDGFGEIIRDKAGRIINLKPLNPANMDIISNKRGAITGYSYSVVAGLPNAERITFKPKQIFHIPWNRIGDEPHGTSVIERMEDIILMQREVMQDMKTLFHRYVKPLYVFHVGTNDTSEIASFKSKVDNAINKSENLIIPAEVAEKIERISVPQYSSLDPLPWLKLLEEHFLIAEGVPEVILGYGRETTEASSKILYLAYQQVIKHNQLFMEEQIKNQLGIKLEFEFPADISPELLEEQRKERNINNMEIDKDVKPTKKQ